MNERVESKHVAFRVVHGLDYTSAKGTHRAEPGDVIPSATKGLPPLPAGSAEWLLEQGAIRPVEAK